MATKRQRRAKRDPNRHCSACGLYNYFWAQSAACCRVCANSLKAVLRDAG